MDGFDFDEVARIINLPHDHIITMMITIGKKRLDARPRSGQLPLEEVYFTDSF
jgi:nitroreductase